MFIAIVKVEANRIAKYARFDDQEAADDHVASVINDYPQAFVTESEAPINNLWVDGTTVTIVPPAKTAAELKAELDNIEREAIMPRGAREAFIALCLQQASAAHLTEPQLYAANPFYRGIKDTDVIATAIRAQIRALT